MSKEEILPSYLSKDDQIAIAVYGSEKEKCALSIRQDLEPQVIDILTTDASLNVLTVLSYNLSLTLKAAIALSRRRIIPFGLFCGRSFDEMWDMRDYAKEPHAEIASSYLFNLFFLCEQNPELPLAQRFLPLVLLAFTTLKTYSGSAEEIEKYRIKIIGAFEGDEEVALLANE